MSVSLDEIDERVLMWLRERTDGAISYINCRPIADDLGLAKSQVGLALVRIAEKGAGIDDLVLEKWSDGSSGAATWMVKRNE